MVDVLLPDEIRVATPKGPVPSCLARRPRTANPEEMDFLLTKTRRAAIHARDGGLCFYCLTQLTPRTRCLDHVIPLARGAKNSYRNLVSCCTECNTQKGETAADDFLRTLSRQRRITSAELADRLRAVDSLSAGQLRPDLPTSAPQSRLAARFSLPRGTKGASQSASASGNPLSPKPRPPYHPENRGSFSRLRNRR